MAVQSVKMVYLLDLIEDEKQLADAEAELNVARAKFELASRKYAAARDWVTQRLGNPYSAQFEWPGDLAEQRAKLVLWGKYRFINMQVGDAVKEVLREADHPLALGEIVKKLNRGRMLTNPRAVNAALMKVAGVAKTTDDKYLFDESASEDTSDLPF